MIPSAPGFPPFRPARPWLGPDLQTLKNVLVRPARSVIAGGTHKLFPMSDGTGDRLTGTLSVPDHRGDEQPLVVLVHGLAGCEKSAYMVASAAHFLARGYPVLRLNLRGSVPTQPGCRQHYHAGRDDDLAVVLQHLTHRTRDQGVVLMGFSLGGNMLLRFLARWASCFPVRAAIIVSAPIDLAAASERFLQVRNWYYHRWLLHHVKANALALCDLTPQGERTIRGARTIAEFDDRVTAPRSGFFGARDYYARCSGKQFLGDIAIPTLVIHAIDDPWIPPDAYLRFAWCSNPHLTPLLQRQGGHVGFHDAAGTWHDRVAALFIERQL